MHKPFRALALLSLLASAATGSGIPEHPAAFFTEAEGAPVDNPLLSVMTYNIAGLPWPLATGRTEALGRIIDRLHTMRRKGTQPHIILLQEAFIPEAQRIARDAGYPHVASGPDAAFTNPVAPGAEDIAFLDQRRWDRGEGIDKMVGSGLLILSDYSIESVDRVAFPDFACAGFDCLANKGALIARVKVPGMTTPISIINTHLNARKAAGVSIWRSQQAFDRQVEILANFIRRQVPAGEPTILGGDMNIGSDPKRSASFFGAFSKVGLSFVTPANSGGHVALTEAPPQGRATRSDLATAIQRRKDWLFARDVSDGPMGVTQAHVPFGAEADGGSLSDHFGYVINYAPSSLSPKRNAEARLQKVQREGGA